MGELTATRSVPLLKKQCKMDNDDVYNHAIRCLRTGACDVGRNEISMPCPGCGDEGHFSINSRTGLFNCFKCPMAGSVKKEILQDRERWFSLVRKPRSLFEEGLSRTFPLCGDPIYPLVYPGPTPGKKGETLPDLHRRAVRAFKYCAKRGMTKEQIEEYKPSIKPFDSRIYFPYWEEGDDGTAAITYWLGRPMNEIVRPKNVSPFGSERPLFGRHIKINRREAVLVEGVFDHFVTPASYAILGSSVTNPQATQLWVDGVKRVYLVQDPDATKEATENARKMGQKGFEVFPVVIHSSKDPAEMGRERMTSIVKILKRHSPTRPQTLYFNI